LCVCVCARACVCVMSHELSKEGTYEFSLVVSHDYR
jgi:hypothetical protein